MRARVPREARVRPGARVSRGALLAPWLALAPALVLVTVLVGVGLGYGVAQSVGFQPEIGQITPSLEAYRQLALGEGLAGREFWGSLAFSLWVSAGSTVLASALAVALALWLTERRQAASPSVTFVLNWNLAFPHLVWSVLLLLLLAQSGLLARWVAALGWIQIPADFPVLVRDRFGIGILLQYVTKETPFLTLLLLAVLRAQPGAYGWVAENLGATRWQRLRLVTLPLIAPALTSGALLVFGFVFSSYEVPALLGVTYPRMLPVLALRFFNDPDLHARADGMAISLIVTLFVVGVALLAQRRSADA